MEEQTLMALKHELVTITLVAEVGWHNLEQVAERLKTGPGRFGPDEMMQLTAMALGSILELLASASIASRLLWPFVDRIPRSVRDKNLNDRAKEFRAAIGIDESSHLKDRGVRNEYTHIENSVVEWIEKPRKGRPAAFAFGDGSHSEGVPDPEDCFRYWYYLTGELKVGEEHCNLRGLIEELRSIRMKVPKNWEFGIAVPSGRAGAPGNVTENYVVQDGRWVPRG
jgi:hypothetical protein